MIGINQIRLVRSITLIPREGTETVMGRLINPKRIVSITLIPREGTDTTQSGVQAVGAQESITLIPREGTETGKAVKGKDLGGP